MSYDFLMDLALILLSTKLLGLVTQRFQMPQVVGALLAGVLLGPAGLNIIAGTEFLTQISELGVIVLMFSAGMGTDLQELKESGKSGLLVAVLGVLVPLVMGVALTWGAAKVGIINDCDFLEELFIGTVLSATSVSITVETLKEMGKLETKAGNTILAAALIDDLLGLIALTVVSSAAGGGTSILMVLAKIAGFFVFAAVVGYISYRLFTWMLERQHDWATHRNTVLAFVLCLVMSYCAEKFFGVADITGAYAAGLVVACTSKAAYIQSKYNSLCYLLLTPVFFASIGIDAQTSGLNGQLMLFAVLLLLVSIISKLAGCGFGAKICGFSGRESFQVGAGMVCRGEVALIVANRGLSMGVLSHEMMTPIIIMVLGGTILTPILLKLAFRGHNANLAGNGRLADRYDKANQLDCVSEQLLQADRDYMRRK